MLMHASRMIVAAVGPVTGTGVQIVVVLDAKRREYIFKNCSTKGDRGHDSVCKQNGYFGSYSNLKAAERFIFFLNIHKQLNQDKTDPLCLREIVARIPYSLETGGGGGGQ